MTSHDHAFSRLVRHAEYSVDAHSESRYPGRQRDIDDYEYCSRRPRGYYYDSEAVVSKFTRELTHSPCSKVRESLYRLQEAIDNLHWGPDIFIKAMHDIDEAGFLGALRGRVAVRSIIDQIMIRLSGQSCFGLTEMEGEGFSRINVNPTKMFLESSDPHWQMWKVGIHEAMVSQ